MEKYMEEVYPLLKELCKIPAPSHLEEKRAKFIKVYLEDAGFSKVYIDEAKNVICELNCEGSSEITVFAAHTDTVFPDLEPMPYIEKDGKAFCPGIGDDTASVAVLMVAAKYLLDAGATPQKGIVFLLNSCEEGLGNLKGIREFMKNYEGRVKRFITFDSTLDKMVNRAVGSHRYKVTVETEGGHSFNAYGNENAIAHLANIIKKIYEIEVPKKGNSKTTYNVGEIWGGTSVNTIAQKAGMLCEYRSDDVECIGIMKDKFMEIFEAQRSDKVKVLVEVVGERPCADGVDKSQQAELTKICKEIYEEITGGEVRLDSGSTDCNIPMSQGVPSVCIGAYIGGGMHTREEWIEIDSLKDGLGAVVKVIKTLSLGELRWNI